MTTLEKLKGPPYGMIPVDQCKDGYLYIIKARNASIGIFRKDMADFTISRVKFGENYIFEEIHWEASDGFGTAVPIKEIGPTPDFKGDQVAQLAYLNEQAETMRSQIATTFDEWFKARKEHEQQISL